jgi:lipopolysaccharide export system permease protein
MPDFLMVILPIALLLALLYTLTNHARHHEITAMRAAGISLWRLCLPYLVVGFFASLLLFALNELWVPDSADAAEQIRNRHVPPPPGAPGRQQVRNLGFTNARDGRIWRIGVYDTRTGAMTQPQVIWTQPDGSRVWVYAERAVPALEGWTFYNVREFREAAQTNAPPVPLLQTNRLTLTDFSETPEQIRSEIKISNIIAFHGGAKRPDIPITELLNYLRLHPNPSGADRSWLYTKLQGRLAAPWTCLVVVLIAIPFGAASGRRNVFVGVASSILICFVYFVVLQLGLAFGTKGDLPPWLAAWLPNLSFGLTGLWFTAKVR